SPRGAPMRPPTARPLAAAALLAAAVLADAAPQVERRDRFDPEIVLDTGGRTGACDALVYSKDGRFLLAAGDDKVVRVWKVAVGGVGAKTGTVTLLERSSGKILGQTLLLQDGKDLTAGVTALAFSPDGRRVAAGCGDGSVWLWDFKDVRPLGRLAHPGQRGQ